MRQNVNVGWGRSPIFLPTFSDPGSYDGAFVLGVDAGGATVSCSYSFVKGAWDCEAGFNFKAITNVSLKAGGQVSYAQIKIY